MILALRISLLLGLALLFCLARGPCLADYPAVSPKVLKIVFFYHCLLRIAYDMYPNKLACAQGGPDVTLFIL